MSCLVNNANPVIFTFNFQPNNSPNDKRTPMSSILRDVSPNMLFSFLPLYIRTIFPCEEVGESDKVAEAVPHKNVLHSRTGDRARTLLFPVPGKNSVRTSHRNGR